MASLRRVMARPGLVIFGIVALALMILKIYAIIDCWSVLSLWALDWFCGQGRGREASTVVVCLSVGFSGGAECSNFVRCSARLELKPTVTYESSRLRAKNCTLGYEQRRSGVEHCQANRTLIRTL